MTEHGGQIRAVWNACMHAHGQYGEYGVCLCVEAASHLAFVTCTWIQLHWPDDALRSLGNSCNKRAKQIIPQTTGRHPLSHIAYTQPRRVRMGVSRTESEWDPLIWKPTPQAGGQIILTDSMSSMRVWFIPSLLSARHSYRPNCRFSMRRTRSVVSMKSSFRAKMLIW